MLDSDTLDPILVVDLDGTLIRSDMLLECFWSSFSRDWRTPLWALARLMHGKAALKAHLATLASPDPATLPYVPEMLDHIRAWREKGGRTALVTAADQSVAEAIAAHLDLFDEVHGSDGRTNLKGPAKAAFLRDRFGATGYVYAGDSTADLPVWAGARMAVSVGVSSSVRRALDRTHPGCTHLAPRHSQARAMFRAMRPHQWLKNMLLFLPVLAAHALTLVTLGQVMLGILSFSLVASSVYLLNDLLDLEADRAHPRKCRRPLASGALPIKTGMAMVPLLLIGGGLAAAFLPPVFALVLIGYYALTISYSLWLKRKAIVDICALAALYALRVMAGAAAVGISLSVWLLAFSAFLFFSLAAVKRQAELVDMQQRGKTAASGRGYRVGDLPVVQQMAITSGFVAVLVLMLYYNDQDLAARSNYPVLLWGTCLILLYWVSRMSLMAHRGQMDDDPVVFAARDRISLVAIVVMVIFYMVALFL